jgi:arginyl-tRNA synthetase
LTLLLRSNKFLDIFANLWGLVDSRKLPTYEVKELGLAFKKNEDFVFDKSIIITGNEVNDYFKVLLAVLKKIAPQIYDKTTHIGHGMLRLPQG